MVKVSERSTPKNNTTGHRGVGYVEIKGSFYWKAYWVEEGKLRQKTFSVCVYGYQKAKELAIQYRADIVQHLEMLEEAVEEEN